jgi:hypothetical protein
MSGGALAALILGPALLFGLMLTYGLFAKLSQKKEYDFLSYFPYELYEDSQGVYLGTRVFQGLYLLATTGLSVYLLVSFKAYEGSALSYLIGIAVFSFALGAVELLITLVTPRNPKDHLLLFYLFGGLLSVTVAMMGSFLYALSKNTPGEGSALLLFAIVLFCLALGAFLVLLNPRLSKWDRLEAQALPDGTVRYVRPRPFVLAASEWLLIALHLLALLVAAFGYFFAPAPAAL